jgi:hypothetical protein
MDAGSAIAMAHGFLLDSVTAWTTGGLSRRFGNMRFSSARSCGRFESLDPLHCGSRSIGQGNQLYAVLVDESQGDIIFDTYPSGRDFWEAFHG